MGLIYCGIDEAGYGPMLGPLCVGLTAFRMDTWDGKHPPDLWKLLKKGVCRNLTEARSDKRGRVVFADSKKLKLSNQLKTKHPLTHLERAGLSLLMTAGIETPDDAHYFAALGAVLPEETWYAGEASPLPVGSELGEIKIASNVLGSAMQKAGLSVEEIRSTVICERTFNEIVRQTGTKSEATISAIGGHLRCVASRWMETDDDVRIVCDRLGARKSYAEIIERELPGTKAEALFERPECSVYKLRGWSGDCRIMFMAESEDQHLPVAGASIYAKLTRELAMARFNRYFNSLLPDLKPTAGYFGDARRWLNEAKAIIDPPTYRKLVRIG